MPRNHIYLGLTIVIYLVVYTALNRNTRQLAARILEPQQYEQISFANEFGTSVFALVVFAALIFAILRMFKLQSRAYQTLFSLFGTGLVFAALMLVGGALSFAVPLLWALTFIALGVWSLIVSGFILGQAMEISTFKGVLITIGVGVLQSTIVFLVFGVPDNIALPAPATNT